MPEESSKQVIAEVETAEQEVTKDNPKAETIMKRLEKAKALLTAGTGVATATTAAATAVGKLLPLIDTAINYVSKVFHYIDFAVERRPMFIEFKVNVRVR